MLQEKLAAMDCCICMMPLVAKPGEEGLSQAPDQALAALRCGHMMHQGCALQQIEHRGNCPLCRQKQTEEPVVVCVEPYVASKVEEAANKTYCEGLRGQIEELRNKKHSLKKRLKPLEASHDKLLGEVEQLNTNVRQARVWDRAMRGQLTKTEAMEHRETLQQCATLAQGSVAGAVQQRKKSDDVLRKLYERISSLEAKLGEDDEAEVCGRKERPGATLLGSKRSVTTTNDDVTLPKKAAKLEDHDIKAWQEDAAASAHPGSYVDAIALVDEQSNE